MFAVAAIAATFCMLAAPRGVHALPYGHPSQSGSSYPARAGFTLWLVEEFEQPLDLDTDPIWTWSDGGLQEGQVRFVKDGIRFENGRMILEARQGATPTPRSCSHAEVGIVEPKTLTSGEMRTRHNMFRYGFYEVRMRAPMVQPDNTSINGNYISTMFAYRDAKFRHWREIDIEVIGDAVNSVTMNVLNAENTSAWSPWIQASQKIWAEGVNVREEFNTYAFEWLPSGITWFFNGQVVGHHAAGSALPVPDLSTKIMMNLWIFGSNYAFGGQEGWNNRYPMRSEYEWLRFYKWDGDTSYPCADMSTACLTTDDQYLSGNNPCDGIPQVGTVYGEPACSATCSAPAPFGHPAATKSYPARENFTLWLVEEFEQPLDLETDPIWTWSDGGLSEGQVRFEKDAIRFEDGKMILEAKQGTPTPQSCSHAEVGVVEPKTLTSGELRTRHNMFRYGFYEVRMRAPTVQPGNTSIDGNYISTMFAYRDAKFRHWREIDIEVTGDAVNSVTMNVLNAENTSAWNPWIQATQTVHVDGVNVRQEFNTYAFEWLPSGITWYFNGQVVGHHAADSALPVPDLSTKIMMNLWIFSSLYAFGGNEGMNNRYPLRSEYDWFRFYKWDGDTSYPCADMSTACLTADDQYLSGNNPCDGIPQVGTVYGEPACSASCASFEPATEPATGGDASAKKSNFLFP